jgi:hypothetical protein
VVSDECQAAKAERARKSKGLESGGPKRVNNNGAHGAPGPLMSAGLPVLLVGAGVYLQVRRKKSKLNL